MVYLMLAGFCFGTIGLFTNMIGNNISTLLIASIRLLSTATIIYLYQIIRGSIQKVRLNSHYEFLTALIGGVIGFAVTFSLYLKSLLIIPVSEAVFLHYVAFPITTMVYSSIFLNEKVENSELVSLLGAFIGVFLIYNVGFQGNSSSLLGYTLAFISGITYSGALLVLKNLGKNKTTLQSLFWPTLFGGGILLPIGFLGKFNFNLTPNTLVPLLGLIFVSTLIGYSLFAKGLKETKAGVSSIILIIFEPLFATLLSIIFLGEGVSILTALGGGLIIVSGIRIYLKGGRVKKSNV